MKIWGYGLGLGCLSANVVDTQLVLISLVLGKLCSVGLVVYAQLVGETSLVIPIFHCVLTSNDIFFIANLKFKTKSNFGIHTFGR